MFKIVNKWKIQLNQDLSALCIYNITQEPKLNSILLFILSFRSVPSKMMVFETVGSTGLHSHTLVCHIIILLESDYINGNRTLLHCVS